MNVNSLSQSNRPPRKLRTEIRREQIAQAALVLIARNGLNDLNIGALAKEVGVVPSAIYRHYRDKDAVLESVLELISKSLLENVSAVRGATGDPLERLHLLLQRHIRLVRHYAGIPRVIFSEQIFAGNARRRQQIHRIMSDYLQEIGRIIIEGQHAGEISADIPADSAAVMFLGLAQPAVILWLMSKQTFDLAQHTERAWILFRRTLEAGSKGCSKLNGFNQTIDSK